MILRKPSLFAIILLSSIGLNLFFGGILLGKYLGNLSEPKMGHSHSSSGRLKLNWMIESLSAESQEKFRPLLQEHRQLIKPQLNSIKQARRAVHERLTASDFNAEALSEALAKLSQERAEARKIMHIVLVKIASQLDEEERLRLSKATRHRPSSWRRNRNIEPGYESEKGQD